MNVGLLHIEVTHCLRIESMQDQRLAYSEELVPFKIEFVAFLMVVEARSLIIFPCLVEF